MITSRGFDRGHFGYMWSLDKYSRLSGPTLKYPLHIFEVAVQYFYVSGKYHNLYSNQSLQTNITRRLTYSRCFINHKCLGDLKIP